jgi:hypothetical protein
MPQLSLSLTIQESYYLVTFTPRVPGGGSVTVAAKYTSWEVQGSPVTCKVFDSMDTAKISASGTFPIILQTYAL